MNELTSNGVQIYQFPVDDETVAENNKAMNVSKYYSYGKGQSEAIHNYQAQIGNTFKETDRQSVCYSTLHCNRLHKMFSA